MTIDKIPPGIYRVNWKSTVCPGYFTILDVVDTIRDTMLTLPEQTQSRYLYTYRCIMHDGRIGEYCFQPDQVTRVDV